MYKTFHTYVFFRKALVQSFMVFQNIFHEILKFEGFKWLNSVSR